MSLCDSSRSGRQRRSVSGRDPPRGGGDHSDDPRVDTVHIAWTAHLPLATMSARPYGADRRTMTQRSNDLGHAAALLGVLSTPRRLDLLATIVRRQASGADCSLGAVATAMDSSQQALAKDLVRLQECGLLTIESGGVSADLSVLRSAADAVGETLPITPHLAIDPDLARFFSHGRLVTVPFDADLQRRIAKVLVRLLPLDVEMSEAEVNDLLGQVHPDHALLRRLLVDERLVTRHASAGYRRVRAG
ncbi:MAG: DUF2087 domain-containing protein [Streptosporangiales bacterium]|nr:DUF2087 domain-containing protein [Streptosporangiales bacterium]